MAASSKPAPLPGGRPSGPDPGGGSAPRGARQASRPRLATGSIRPLAGAGVHRLVVRALGTNAVLAIVLGLVEHGFDVEARALPVQVLDLLLVAGVAVELGIRSAVSPRRLRYLRDRWADVLTLAVAVLAVALGKPRIAGAVAGVRTAIVGLELLRGVPLVERAFVLLQRRPLLSLVASFAGVIALGALLLTFPASTQDHQGAPFLVALFTSTSATCVTGLVVVDTGTYWSRFGQWIILGMFQVGGLGIMTITTALAMVFRANLTLHERRTMEEILEEDTLAGFRRLIARTVLLALAFEAIGATLLFLRFEAQAARLGLGEASAGTLAFHAVFHSVSAFCNAGFALHSDSMMRLVGDVPVNAVLAVLIVCGGLGFPVVSDLLRPEVLRSPRRAWRRLPVHTRLVLLTSGVLLGAGAVGYLLVEWNGALGKLGLGERLLAAGFASVTARTAGFNTVDYGLLTPAGVLLTVVLMFIGGSPGGTAGGIKTSTAAVMLLSVKTMLQGRPDVEVWEREVPRSTVYRAVAVTFISGAGLALLFLLLLVVEPQPFDRLLFEAVSAFGTVGLSMNLTPELSTAGRLIVIVLMFAGRLGPFTLALAIGASRKPAGFSYPSAKVVVG